MRHMYWRAVDLACCSVSYQWTELISRNSRLFQVQWHCTTITYSMIMGIASKLVCGWGWKSYLVGVSLSMCVANISVSLGLSRFLAFRCCFVCSAPVDTRKPFIQWCVLGRMDRYMIMISCRLFVCCGLGQDNWWMDGFCVAMLLFYCSWSQFATELFIRLSWAWINYIRSGTLPTYL